jgi:hypothetical protein
MTAVVRGILSWLILVAVILALAFAVPALVHLLIELPRIGWESV